MRAERGQASVELIGAIPVVMVIALVSFQLLAVGYAAVLAGTAAEAGAIALAGGADPRTAARAAVPGWQKARMKIEADGSRVRVRMRPPAPLDRVERMLEVAATAAVEAR